MKFKQLFIRYARAVLRVVDRDVSAKVTQGYQATLVYLDSEESLGSLGALDPWEQWARRERRGMKDVLETMGTRASEETLELMDLLAHQDCL